MGEDNVMQVMLQYDFNKQITATIINDSDNELSEKNESNELLLEHLYVVDSANSHSVEKSVGNVNFEYNANCNDSISREMLQKDNVVENQPVMHTENESCSTNTNIQFTNTGNSIETYQDVMVINMNTNEEIDTLEQEVIYLDDELADMIKNTAFSKNCAEKQRPILKKKIVGQEEITIGKKEVTTIEDDDVTVINTNAQATNQLTFISEGKRLSDEVDTTGNNNTDIVTENYIINITKIYTREKDVHGWAMWVTSLVNKVSANLCLIIRCYYENFHKNQRLLKDLKTYIFTISYGTVVLIMLPQEKNDKFVTKFIDKTVTNASKVLNWKCEPKHVKPFYEELIKWSKRKRDSMKSKRSYEDSKNSGVAGCTRKKLKYGNYYKIIEKRIKNNMLNRVTLRGDITQKRNRSCVKSKFNSKDGKKRKKLIRRNKKGKKANNGDRIVTQKQLNDNNSIIDTNPNSMNETKQICHGRLKATNKLNYNRNSNNKAIMINDNSMLVDHLDILQQPVNILHSVTAPACPMNLNADNSKCIFSYGVPGSEITINISHDLLLNHVGTQNNNHDNQKSKNTMQLNNNNDSTCRNDYSQRNSHEIAYHSLNINNSVTPQPTPTQVELSISEIKPDGNSTRMHQNFDVTQNKIQSHITKASHVKENNDRHALKSFNIQSNFHLRLQDTSLETSRKTQAPIILEDLGPPLSISQNHNISAKMNPIVGYDQNKMHIKSVNSMQGNINKKPDAPISQNDAQPANALESVQNFNLHSNTTHHVFLPVQPPPTRLKPALHSCRSHYIPTKNQYLNYNHHEIQQNITNTMQVTEGYIQASACQNHNQSNTQLHPHNYNFQNNFTYHESALTKPPPYSSPTHNITIPNQNFSYNENEIQLAVPNPIHANEGNNFRAKRYHNNKINQFNPQLRVHHYNTESNITYHKSAPPQPFPISLASPPYNSHTHNSAISNTNLSGTENEIQANIVNILQGNNDKDIHTPQQNTRQLNIQQGGQNYSHQSNIAYMQSMPPQPLQIQAESEIYGNRIHNIERMVENLGSDQPGIQSSIINTSQENNNYNCYARKSQMHSRQSNIYRQKYDYHKSAPPPPLYIRPPAKPLSYFKQTHPAISVTNPYLSHKQSGINANIIKSIQGNKNHKNYAPNVESMVQLNSAPPPDCRKKIGPKPPEYCNPTFNTTSMYQNHDQRHIQHPVVPVQVNHNASVTSINRLKEVGFCNVCGRNTAITCKKCHKISYCSKVCQAMDIKT